MSVIVHVQDGTEVRVTGDDITTHIGDATGVLQVLDTEHGLTLSFASGYWTWIEVQA